MWPMILSVCLINDLTCARAILWTLRKGGDSLWWSRKPYGSWPTAVPSFPPTLAKVPATTDICKRVSPYVSDDLSDTRLGILDKWLNQRFFVTIIWYSFIVLSDALKTHYTRLLFFNISRCTYNVYSLYSLIYLFTSVVIFRSLRKNKT